MSDGQSGESSGAEVVPMEKPKRTFGGLDPREAGRRGVEKRRQNALERQRDKTLVKQAAELKIKDAPSRDSLKGSAAAVLHDIAYRILADDIPINTAREAASVADVFFNILRLESGQSTANVEHLSSEEKMAQIKAMQDAVRARQATAPISVPAIPPTT